MASLDRTQERTRSEIADYLRNFADELDPDVPASQSGSAGDVGAQPTATTTSDSRDLDSAGSSDRRPDASVGEKVTVIAGNDSATINPPRTCRFDVGVETDSDLLDTGAERSTTFTIRWSEKHAEADDELRVE